MAVSALLFQKEYFGFFCLKQGEELTINAGLLHETGCNIKGKITAGALRHRLTGIKAEGWFTPRAWLSWRQAGQGCWQRLIHHFRAHGAWDCGSAPMEKQRLMLGSPEHVHETLQPCSTDYSLVRITRIIFNFPLGKQATSTGNYTYYLHFNVGFLKTSPFLMVWLQASISVAAGNGNTQCINLPQWHRWNLCLQEEKESRSWQKGFYLFVVCCFHFSGSHMNQLKSSEHQNKSQ